MQKDKTFCQPQPSATGLNPLVACVLATLLFITGCTSPPTHSVDDKANYEYVFGDVAAPVPEIVHSHVEREHRSVLGMIPLSSQYNGEWEFEMVVSSAWLIQVKNKFVQIPFADVWQRTVPDWFVPTSDGFSAWKMQATSFPNAHLFIEKKPQSPNRIRVFIRRH